MRKIALTLLLLASSTQIFADTYVRGHTRSDGTQVQGHYRSDANSTDRDNWSTKGNINPHTGQEGTKSPSGYDSYKSNSDSSSEHKSGSPLYEGNKNW